MPERGQASQVKVRRVRALMGRKKDQTQTGLTQMMQPVRTRMGWNKMRRLRMTRLPGRTKRVVMRSLEMIQRPAQKEPLLVTPRLEMIPELTRTGLHLGMIQPLVAMLVKGKVGPMVVMTLIRVRLMAVEPRAVRRVVLMCPRHRQKATWQSTKVMVLRLLIQHLPMIPYLTWLGLMLVGHQMRQHRKSRL